MARRGLAVVLGVLIAVGVAAASVRLRERAKAKTTADRIRVLSTILLAERPSVITPRVLATLTAKYKRPDVLKDEWGRDLIVEIQGGKYVVTSFGRDGTSSGCCASSHDASPDTDLIAVDGAWKQIWN
jgi:hypothetical protein